MSRAWFRTRWLVAVVASTLFLAGCAASTSRHSMMGGPATQTGMMSGFGGGMMGNAPPGYQLSRLSCSAPNDLPGTPVYVMLGDMGMSHLMGGVAPIGGHMMLRAVPAHIPVGTVSFIVANMGWRTHELVVLPLATGQAAGQRTPGADGLVDEAGSLGEASAPCAPGTGDGITSGSVGWVTLDLPAGRYELICNLRNHYANGMHQLLVVT